MGMDGDVIRNLKTILNTVIIQYCGAMVTMQSKYNVFYLQYPVTHIQNSNALLSFTRVTGVPFLKSHQHGPFVWCNCAFELL